jgi:hypothetical protein
MEKGVEAAIRRFPLKAQEIRRVALANTTFRSLCEDFADAETAFEKLGLSSTIQNEARRSEYQVLIKELAIEIEHMLATLCGDKLSTDEA